MMNQETRRLNTAEVVLPQEVHQESAVNLPALMPSSPLDWPVERFTQALDRREVNRRALLKWVQGNLQAGIDYGQIHVVGKDKCRLAGDGRAHECLDPRHWSKASLWKPGAEKICGMLGLIPQLPQPGRIRESHPARGGHQGDHPQVRASHGKRFCGRRGHRCQESRSG